MVDILQQEKQKTGRFLGSISHDKRKISVRNQNKKTLNDDKQNVL